MSNETRYKLRLIKKYAKIRFRRFWREWGVSKEETKDFLSIIAIFALLIEFYILGILL